MFMIPFWLWCLPVLSIFVGGFGLGFLCDISLVEKIIKDGTKNTNACDNTKDNIKDVLISLGE